MKRQSLIPSIITEEEAIKLCSGGEWITDLKIKDMVADKAKELQQQFQEWKQPDMPGPNISHIVNAFDSVNSVLDELFEHKVIAFTGLLSPFAELRVRANAVYKVIPTLMNTAVHGISLVIAVLAVTTFSNLFLIWAGVGVNVVTIVYKLYKGWEILSDPDERLVFEEIFKLQGKLVTVNYDAVKNKDFDAAYGTVSPPTDDIAAAIGNRLSRRELEKTLAALKNRDVVHQRRGRWSIKL